MKHKKNGLRTVGIVAASLGAAAALATGAMLVASIPDLIRYLRIRQM